MRLIRFSLALVVLLGGSLTGTLPVAAILAAPAALGCGPANSAITSPQSGASLSGPVQIEGNATLGGDFQYYKLEFSPEGRDAFTVFSGLVRQPVSGGQLAVWDSASVPDGNYVIRLRVVDKTGNYCEASVGGLHVQNSAPVAPTGTPTAVETEAPAPFSVVPTALPTIEIPGNELTSGQAQPSAEATPSGTRTSGGGSSLLPGGFNLDGITSALGELFAGYARAFVFGILAMAGIFVLIGVVFYVRRVL